MSGKQVVAKRGCTCCGTGCAIPVATVALVTFGLSGTFGAVVAAVVALPVAVGASHVAAWVVRHPLARPGAIRL